MLAQQNADHSWLCAKCRVLFWRMKVLESVKVKVFFLSRKSESVLSLEKKQFRSHSLAPSLWHQAGLEDVSLLLSFYRGRVASIKTRS